jgi:hypothetical protein
LENCIEELKKIDTKNSSRNDKLAYWINIYNAFTLKKIVTNYPISSITKLDGGKPWDHKFIEIAGKTYSLNEIENEIIRPTFQEPRIHFAVNCAANSCPPLLNLAYTSDNLEKLLEQQTRSFINNTTHNTIGIDKLNLSKIFDWYSKDFGNVIAFINRYSKVKIKADAEIKYNEYDWNLNGN